MTELTPLGEILQAAELTLSKGSSLSDVTRRLETLLASADDAFERLNTICTTLLGPDAETKGLYYPAGARGAIDAIYEYEQAITIRIEHINKMASQILGKL